MEFVHQNYFTSVVSTQNSDDVDSSIKSLSLKYLLGFHIPDKNTGNSYQPSHTKFVYKYR